MAKKKTTRKKDFLGPVTTEEIPSTPPAPYKEWQTCSVRICIECGCKTLDRRAPETLGEPVQCPTCGSGTFTDEKPIKICAWPMTFLPSVFVLTE